MPRTPHYIRCHPGTLRTLPAGTRSRRLGRLVPRIRQPTVLEAVLRIARTGAAWRDLPTEFGNWNSIYQRFRRWCRGGVFQGNRFAKLAADLGLDLETALVDGTFVKVHQHGTGPPKGDAATLEASRELAAVGVSPDGLTTKTLTLTDQVGRLAGFVLTPGNAYEPAARPALLDGVWPPPHELIADKAYDTDVARRRRAERGIAAVIPSRWSRQEPRWYDTAVYGMRHLVANRFAAVAVKEFRGIAMRYRKRSLMYGEMFNPVSAFVAFRVATTRRPARGRPAVNRKLPW